MEDNLKELLKAEQEVNKKVQEAINKKNQMMRSIKESAEKDIDQYRKAVEKQYNEEYERLKKHIEAEGKKDNQDTVDMAKIEEDYAKNKDMVVDLLVKNVLSVNIEIPKVVKGAF